MEVGSWRDPEVARDLTILAVCVVVTVFAVTLPVGLVALLLLPIAVGSLVAILMRLRGGPEKSLAGPMELPHRGPNASRISLAGFPGGAFVVASCGCSGSARQGYARSSWPRVPWGRWAGQRLC